MGKNKFDVVLANPPYDKGLYKKFLEKSISISEHMVSVNPMDFLLGKKKQKNICELIDNKGCNIELIKGQEFFDAGIWGLLGIVHAYESGKIIYNGKQYNSLFDIHFYSDDEYLTILSDIIKPLNSNDCLQNHIKMKEIWWAVEKNDPMVEYNPNDKWWCLSIAQLRGHQGKNGVADDYYTFIPKDKVSELYKTISQDKTKYYFAFNSKNECDNFINYLKSDFARACLRTIKTTGQLLRGELKYIPWFDFSDSVFSKSPKEIDDYLFAKFNISDEIRKHIEEILPDYYGIR